MPAPVIVAIEQGNKDADLSLDNAKELLVLAEAEINRLYDEVLFWKGQCENQVTMEQLKHDLDAAHALRQGVSKKLKAEKDKSAEAARAARVAIAEKKLLEEELKLEREKGGRPA